MGALGFALLLKEPLPSYTNAAGSPLVPPPSEAVSPEQQHLVTGHPVGHERPVTAGAGYSINLFTMVTVSQIRTVVHGS